MDLHEVPEMVGNVTCDLEADNDTGYSSHDSSCHQEDGSENSWKLNPYSVSKTPSSEPSPQPVIDWCYAEDETMEGVDEIEDLLYHFEKFFHDKLECHVKDFSSAMYSMFSEQQIHMRQIVNAAMCSEHNQDQDFPQEFEKQNTFSAATGLDVQKRERDMLYSNDVNIQLLVELLSLSCELSSLLHQDKFRS